MFEKMRVKGTDLGCYPDEPIDFLANLTACNTEDELTSYRYEATSRTIDHILRTFRIQVDKNSYEYKKLCREMAIADKKWAEVELRRNKGDYSDDIEKIFPVPPDSDLEKYLHSGRWPEEAKEESSITLKEVIDEYCKRQVQSGKWSDNTIRNHQTKINTMLQVIGDRPVNVLTVADVRRLAKILEFLPPGFARINEYVDLSKIAPEELEGKHNTVLDVSTRRDYLNFVKSVFNYAEENEYIQKNPVVSGIIPPKKKKTKDLKLPFDDPGDLEKIFNPAVFLKWSEDHASRFWLPILALYTGCRLEEMASLYCEDVFEHNGIWSIDINDNHDRKVKNQNAIRSVPLHPILVDQFNFPQYVEMVKADGHERVFPELYVVNFKYGHEFSKRFGYYLRNNKEVSITDNKKTFHSFRHNVSDHLYKKLVMESLIEELTGRAGKTETRKTYTKGYRVETLYEECILKLEYEVNLSSLKNSKWVPR